MFWGCVLSGSRLCRVGEFDVRSLVRSFLSRRCFGYGWGLKFWLLDWFCVVIGELNVMFVRFRFGGFRFWW